MVSYERLKDKSMGLAIRVYRKGTQGEYFSALCPWHDDRTNPSLMVHKTGPITSDGKYHGGYWECLAGCGSGGLTTLFRKVANWERNGRPKVTPDFKEPPKPWIPSDRESMEAVVDGSHAILLREPELGWYIEERQLSGRIEPCRLGYYDGWISIPVYGDRGELRSVVLRATPPVVGRYNGLRFHSPSLAPELYVPNWRGFERSDTVALVFGMFDALTFDDMLIPVCTSTHGNESFNMTWAMRLQDKKVVMFPDAPAQEQQAAERLAHSMKMLGIRVSVALLPYGPNIKDPNDFLRMGKRVELEKEMIKWF